MLDTFKLLIELRMVKLLPLFIWTQFSLNTISGIFVTMMTDTMDVTPKDKDWTPSFKNKQCLLAMVGLGVGEIAGSLLFG
jgi:hypothetical protein